MLSLFIELHERSADQLKLSSKKYLATPSDKYPNKEKFVQNKVLMQIAGNMSLKNELEKRKLKNWYLNNEYIKILYRETVECDAYGKYMSKGESTYEGDKDFLIDLFKNVIAPNEKICEYFEDDKLTWVDDIHIVNTFILKISKNHSIGKKV